MTDDELDGLLAQSGSRWRASHTTVASVAFDAAASDAEIIQLQYDDYVPPPMPPDPHRRLWPWVLAAAAAAVLSVGIVVVARPTQPVQSGADQRGPYGNWSLISFTDDSGPETRATGTKTLEISAQFGDNNLSTLSVSAGCGQSTGFVAVHVDSPPSAGNLTIGEMTGNASGCAVGLSGQVAVIAAAQADAIDTVLSTGKTPWHYEGSHLVLTRGKDSLTYERSSAPTERAAALLGTSWKLSNYSDATGNVRSKVGEASLTVAVNSTFSGSDGCNKLSGTLGVNGTPLDPSANASGTAVFEPGVLTEIGCPSGNGVDVILFGPGAVDWAIYDGGKLVIERAGVGTLVYVAAAIAPSPPSGSVVSGGAALVGSSWDLDRWCVGPNCTSATWVSAAPRLDFTTEGRFLYMDDCKHVVGSAEIGNSTLRLRSDNGNTSRSCSGLQIGAVLATDGSDLQWQLSQPMQLTIRSDNRSLVFVQHDSPATLEQSTSAPASTSASPQVAQLAGRWVFTGYCSGGGACANNSVTPGTKPTLTISSDGKVTGSYGCASTAYAGTLTSHADSTFAIDFSHDVSSGDAATCLGSGENGATRWTVLHNPKIEWSVNLPQMTLTVGDAGLQYQSYAPVASPVNSAVQ